MWGGSEVTVVTTHSYGKGEGVGWVSVTNLTIVCGVVNLMTVVYFSGCSRLILTLSPPLNTETRLAVFYPNSARKTTWKSKPWMEDNIKMNIKGSKITGMLDISDCGQGQVCGCCERGHGPSASTKRKEM
jgi:hypothetical protein